MALMSALLGAGMVAAGPLAAQESAAGRYTMHKTDDGFVRLDTQTGAVSLCQKDNGGWRCREIANASEQEKNAGAGAGADELAQLRQENKELREEIVRLEELLGLRGPSEGSRPRDHSFKLPSEKDVDQAFDYFERMLRKFQDRLKRLEQEKQPGPERQL